MADFIYLSFFEKKKKKIIKNAISRKPKRFEQSYLDSKIATPECTLAATHYKVEKIKFGQFLYLNFFAKKNIKKS